MKALLIIEQCNPEWSSVPLEGYQYYQAISNRVESTLVTHMRNRAALLAKHPDKNIIFINESNLIKLYHQIIAYFTYRKKVIWPLYNALSYLVFAEFNQQVYQQFNQRVLAGEYDIVHAITPMMPRYPFKLIKSCKTTPFILGPVNGGVPFPKGFKSIARKEFSYLNFLRFLGYLLIHEYRETYTKANKILAGSSYTLNTLKKTFKLDDKKISLLYENGVTEDFLMEKEKSNYEKINLLFVGRLVPYKGADLVIEAISILNSSVREKINLIIVGDGHEKNNLETQVKNLNLQNIVTFTGWIKQDETKTYYQRSDIFCFPSIREFGGAVVLEAMAAGLPCIVVNNGGIGEYVTDETGFKLEPTSRESLVFQIKEKIEYLSNHSNIICDLSSKAQIRAKEFLWDIKAKLITDIYSEQIYQ